MADDTPKRSHRDFAAMGKAKAKPVELPRKRVNLGTLLKAMPLPFAR